MNSAADGANIPYEAVAGRDLLLHRCAAKVAKIHFFEPKAKGRWSLADLKYLCLQLKRQVAMWLSVMLGHMSHNVSA